MRRSHLYFWLLGFTVLLGAWSAHGLDGWLSEKKIDSFKVGVQYQMMHGLALLVLELFKGQTNLSFQRKLKITQNWLLLGILCFSGSIYLLALNEYLNLIWIKWLWPVTPIGGLLLMIGWFWGGYQFYKNQNEK
jgi:uncharacterized membrane protein YgdD (TMEM256/DUF423 family)